MNGAVPVRTAITSPRDKSTVNYKCIREKYVNCHPFRIDRLLNGFVFGKNFIFLTLLKVRVLKEARVHRAKMLNILIKKIPYML